jgi:hypothetical protein
MYMHKCSSSVLEKRNNEERGIEREKEKEREREREREREKERERERKRESVRVRLLHSGITLNQNVYSML